MISGHFCALLEFSCGFSWQHTLLKLPPVTHLYMIKHTVFVSVKGVYATIFSFIRLFKRSLLSMFMKTYPCPKPETSNKCFLASKNLKFHIVRQVENTTIYCTLVRIRASDKKKLRLVFTCLLFKQKCLGTVIMKASMLSSIWY